MGKNKKKKNLVDRVLDAVIPEPRWPFPLGGAALDEQIKMNAKINDFLDDTRNINYVHVRNEKTDGYSYTFAYRPSVSGKRSNFVDLAVAVCAPEDQFNRKLGRDLSTSRLLNGEYISLPLGFMGLDRVPALLHSLFDESLHIELVLQSLKVPHE